MSPRYREVDIPAKDAERFEAMARENGWLWRKKGPLPGDQGEEAKARWRKEVSAAKLRLMQLSNPDPENLEPTNNGVRMLMEKAFSHAHHPKFDQITPDSLRMALAALFEQHLPPEIPDNVFLNPTGGVPTLTSYRFSGEPLRLMPKAITLTMDKYGLGGKGPLLLAEVGELHNLGSSAVMNSVRRVTLGIFLDKSMRKLIIGR